jgi:hypothetical protein
MRHMPIVRCVLVALGLGLAVAQGAATGSPVATAVGQAPGALTHTYTYGDAWRGWPVTPAHAQHPIRGSLDDPRPSGYHIGLDISVRDDLPEPGAPANRTHRVRAIEGGTVSVAANVASVGCVNRIVRVGHFAYWHVDPVGTVTPGQVILPGQHIGWTCRGLWHVHLSEWVEVGGVRTWVDPLHAGGKLAPFTDSAPPAIRSIRFFRPAATVWQQEGAVLVAPPRGVPLSTGALHGLVDVRAEIDDPQSFRGWFVGQHAGLYAPHHPYRVRVTLRRGGPAGKVLLDRDVFRGDRVLGEGEEVTLVEPSLAFAGHFAPGTRQNLGAKRCVELAPAPCAGRTVVRLFAGPGGRRFWNTTLLANGRYRLTVRAWDRRGNVATRSVAVVVSN